MDYNRRDQGCQHRGGTWSQTVNFGSKHPHDVAQWGYIILYLVVIIGSLVGNCIFLFTIKKNQHLRSTPHFLLSSLALRDIIVTILVIPFVMDSQAVKYLEWTIGDPMCKFYTFANMGTMAMHGFTLVFLLLFLYFWYRKQEAYMTEDGQTVTRKTRMHKWSIPLACVIAAGLAIPAGAIAGANCNASTGIQSCAIWSGQANTTGHKIAISLFFVAFLLPLLILVFPLIALTMQVFGCREPRLDQQKHCRLALTGILLVIVYAVSLSPYQVYEAMKAFQKTFGTKFNPTWGTPGGPQWTFNTDLILNAMIYVACVIHPIIYFSVNPEYRTGLRYAWKHLYCNKDPVQREREEAEKRQRRMMQRQYPGRDNRTPIIKSAGEPLVNRRQPQIMPSGGGQPHYYPYPQGYPQQSGTLQPLLGNTNNFGGVHQPATNQILFPDQHFIDTSFESALTGSIITGHVSPQLPPVFEYDGLKYIDTARVEPRIAYSPQKTPPKTPPTPHFGQKPFANPLDGMLVNPELAIATIPMQSPQPLQEHFEMVDMSSPIATSEWKDEERPKRSSMELEQLEVSPGNTLRDRTRRQLRQDIGLSPPQSPTGDVSPVPVVEILQESPGNRQRRRTTESKQEERAPLIPTAYTNGANISGSHPSLGASSAGGERPASRNSAVEIVITGRTRSRTDLCPEVPKSKFEHSV